MGFRLRQNLRLAKGLRLNFSKSGISLSAGPRGATTNIGLGGVKETLGLPGTGVSYQTGDITGLGSRRRRKASWFWIAIVLLVLGVKYFLNMH